MKKILKVIFLILLIGVMLISSYYFYKNLKEDKKQEDIFEEIKDIAETNIDNEKIKDNEIDISKLYEINNDIVGWIKIDDTKINYPVMQTKDRPNFYLRKNFYKEYSYWGTPFLSENCDVETSDNLIIYGHHINNSKMFGELEKYKKEDYYKNHKIIKFYTMKDKSEYEIISIFKTNIDTGFPYYKFINFNNKDEFNTFLNKCNELSFYNIREETIYGDKFITLSTCDYSSRNGRLVVIAKKINY